MTRQEQLEFCSVCTNRSFNPNAGIVCGLTNEVATFQTSCESYSPDEREIENKKVWDNSLKKDTKKSINKGRNALFTLGGLFLLIGIYEGFMMIGAIPIAGYIDWGFSAIFIGLGIWSIKQPFPALITGLSFYVLLLILTGIVDPRSILSGIILKLVILSYLVYAIITAKNEPKKAQTKSEDLLDN